jgi:DNA-binding NtrC family response regulator
MPSRIMIIDNEEGLCRMMEAVLLDHGFEVEFYTDPIAATNRFQPGAWDLVISDIKMPGMDGLEVLEFLRRRDAELPVVMVTAFATVEMSIQALRKGAYDMLTKPFEPDELLYRVKNALSHTRLLEENRELRHELASRFNFDRIIGVSTSLQAMLDKVAKVAVRDISVLITGESGTGKELIAQALHYHSPRSEQRFVAINCGALPASVLESELFGYKKGAFTGALQDKTGLLEAAAGGTLFLDEVGNLPLEVQKTLLRFIQEREFLRVGDTRPTRVDVRLVSATNSDLLQEIRRGTFREDLYYRLNVVNVHLPPLRERKEDIPVLAMHFVRQLNERFGTRIAGFDKAALEALVSFDWPGNIRQLQNLIEAAVTMESSTRISLATLSQLSDLPDAGGVVSGADGSYTEALASFEIDYLKGLLQTHAGNIEAVAQVAGMNMATIYRKLKKYNLKKTELD